MKTYKKFKIYLDEIITREQWKEKYKDIVDKNFNKDDYKKYAPQVFALFKKLNGGKLKKTLVFDLKDKVKELNKTDMALIEALLNADYMVNKTSYLAGMATNEKNKQVAILDILNSFKSKQKDKLETAYKKIKNDKIKKQIDFMDNLEDLNILKNRKINISKLSIYDNKGMKIILTYDIRAISSQSTSVGWTSCMNLDDGEYNHQVGAGISDGVFIAYLVKGTKDLTLDNPTARILFKPYEGANTGKLFWKADKIYPPTTPGEFKTRSQQIVDKAQGRSPKDNDLFVLTPNTYVDDIDDTINNLDGDSNDLYQNPIYIKKIKNPTESQQIIAMKGNEEMIKYIKNPTEKVQLMAILEDPDYIRYIKNPTEKVQIKAVSNYGPSIQFIKNPSEEVKKAAIIQTTSSLRYIKDPSEELQILAVKDVPDALEYIKNPTEKTQLVAVKNNGWIIQYIKKPSEKVQLAAVKNDKIAIQYIKKPSEKVQIAAVKAHTDAIEYIKNPSEKVMAAI